MMSVVSKINELRSMDDINTYYSCKRIQFNVIKVSINFKCE